MDNNLKKTLFLFLIAVLVVQGCIATAATMAIKHSRGKKSDEAAVELEATPNKVYEAELKVMEKQPDIEIIGKDPGNNLVTAARGDDLITARATPVRGGKTELVVKAESKDDFKRGEEPALDIEKEICKELGFKYRVEE